MPQGPAVERWLAPFFSESTLWPVTIVMFLVLGSLGASLLLLAFADRNLFAIAALVGLGWMSADALRPDLARRRLGVLGGSVLALWGLAALGAFGAARLGLF